MTKFLIFIIFLFQLIKCFKIELQMTKYNYRNSIIKTSQYLQLINFVLPTFEICLGTPLQWFTVAVANDFSHHYIPEANPEIPLRTPKAFDVNKTTSVINKQATIFSPYQNGLLKGRIFEEIFRFPNAINLQFNMLFILFEPFEEYTSEIFDGFFGFGKQKEKDEDFKGSIWNALDELKITNEIQSKVIGVHYNKQGGNLYIGEEFLNGNYSRCNSVAFYHSWSCPITSLRMADSSYSFYFNVIFDSISKVITGPKVQVLLIYNIIISRYPGLCDIYDEVYQSLLICDNSLNIESIPDIYFYLSTGEAFIIKGKNIFEPIIIEDKEKYVSTMICNNIGQVTWIFGIPAFMDNMIVFDHDKMTVGFFQIEQKTNGNQPFINKCSFTLIKSICVFVILLCLSGVAVALFNSHFRIK